MTQTVGWHESDAGEDARLENEPPTARAFATKAIRIISLAPSPEDDVPKLWSGAEEDDDEASGRGYRRGVRAQSGRMRSLRDFFVNGDDSD